VLHAQAPGSWLALGMALLILLFGVEAGGRPCSVDGVPVLSAVKIVPSWGLHLDCACAAGFGPGAGTAEASGTWSDPRNGWGLSPARLTLMRRAVAAAGVPVGVGR
jgi:hypothetical protein